MADNVVPFTQRRPGRLQPPAPFTSFEHQAFSLARRVMMQRLVEWAATRPNPADLEAELATLPAVLDQLCQLTASA